MNPRGKSIAISSAGVGVAVMVAAGFAAKDWVLQEWYSHRLLSGDEADQDKAIDGLLGLGPARAVPAILKIVRGRPPQWVTREPTPRSPQPDPVLRLDPLVDRLQDALVGMGKAAVPQLLKAIGHQDPNLAVIAARAIKRVYNPQLNPRRILLPGRLELAQAAAVLDHLRGDELESGDVREAAAEALTKIQPR